MSVTTSSGCLPSAVSSESITATVPSSVAGNGAALAGTPPDTQGQPAAGLPTSLNYDPTSGAGVTGDLGEGGAVRIAELQAKLAKGADNLTAAEAKELIALEKQGQ